jgi:hypothetical protein
VKRFALGLVALAASLMLAGCTRKASDPADEPVSEAVQAKQLKRARRAAAVLMNAAAIQVAVFNAAMGGPVGDAAAKLGKAVTEKSTAAEIAKALDTLAEGDLIEAKFADPFKGMKTEPRRELARAFAHKLVQRGPTLAAKVEADELRLPPLTRFLKDDELERYVLILSLPPSKQQDLQAVQGAFKDLDAWRQDVLERSKDDKDLERVVAACAKAG